MPTASAILARRFGLVQPIAISHQATQELVRVLNKAAVEANRAVIAAMRQGTFSGNVRAMQLLTIQRNLEKLTLQLWNNAETITEIGVQRAIDLATQQGIALDGLLGIPKAIAEQIQIDPLRGAQDIVLKASNNIPLSERIYKNGQLGIKQVNAIVNQGLAMQLSAKELAARVFNYYIPTVPGGASFASMRLARTEINNAHHAATIANAQNKPWVEGFIWHLSSSHPRPDICNDYADQGYFDKYKVPQKPHPHCLCYLEIAQIPRQRFLANLRNGDYDSFLSSQGVSRSLIGEIS